MLFVRRMLNLHAKSWQMITISVQMFTMPEGHGFSEIWAEFRDRIDWA